MLTNHDKATRRQGLAGLWPLRPIGATMAYSAWLTVHATTMRPDMRHLDETTPQMFKRRCWSSGRSTKPARPSIGSWPSARRARFSSMRSVSAIIKATVGRVSNITTRLYYGFLISGRLKRPSLPASYRARGSPDPAAAARPKPDPNPFIADCSSRSPARCRAAHAATRHVRQKLAARRLDYSIRYQATSPAKLSWPRKTANLFDSHGLQCGPV